jgi:hypothetical protein
MRKTVQTKPAIDHNALERPDVNKKDAHDNLRVLRIPECFTAALNEANPFPFLRLALCESGPSVKSPEALILRRENPIRIIERRILLRQRMSCDEHLYGSEETMPDDLNKRGAQDRARVSKQEHEQRYQRRKRSSSSTRSKSKSSRRKKS